MDCPLVGGYSTSTEGNQTVWFGYRNHMGIKIDFESYLLRFQNFPAHH